jgi:hypothetical protein
LHDLFAALAAKAAGVGIPEDRVRALASIAR